ncbi:NifB/NifX family molybdenum-iron cluster-binding protein [Vibrio sp. M260118]|uniref:NifB/NifX family molybdenum-iron cluster-binding protein n=1 Tax=Vibrio sp. M260118 TaxID=3020896 RepID=UPI002F401D1C
MIERKRKLHVEPPSDGYELAIKVAFATSDRHLVDQHFGSAEGMLIYGVAKQEWHLLEAIEYSESDGQTHQRLPNRINDLKGCAAVYCIACGASAIRQLLGEDINPVRVEPGYDIHLLLQKLQIELRTQPAGWLARALKRSQSGEGKQQNRLQNLMDEEW